MVLNGHIRKLSYDFSTGDNKEETKIHHGLSNEAQHAKNEEGRKCSTIKRHGDRE